jgi:hypothetical protein
VNESALRDGVRTWSRGLGLSLLRRPRSVARPATFTVALLAMLFSLLVFTAVDRVVADAPAAFWIENLLLHAGYFLCVLVIAALAANGIGRTAIWLRLAALWLVADIPWTAAWQILSNTPAGETGHALWWRVVIGGMLWAVLIRSIGWVGVDAKLRRRWGVATIVFALLAFPWLQRQDALLWGDTAPSTDTVPNPAPAAGRAVSTQETEGPRPPPLLFHPESLIAAQAGLLAKATQALKPQTPGQVDLYAIGFAGDSEEAVFRNEVDYLTPLLAGRFGADGRVLPLVNSYDTIANTPLASLTNLRQGLKDVAARMDPQEDVLLLFLTSHGSREHELLVDLGDLPMHQIDPGELRAALDTAGIRWRVVVVSACFSGGFIKALSDPHTLVITAARADRTSFGCGHDSEITWFGKAYLTEALNQTTDFRAAFDIASKQISTWEREADYESSKPQVSEGALIGAKLEQLRATLPSSSAVPFVPTVPAPPLVQDDESG